MIPDSVRIELLVEEAAQGRGAVVIGPRFSGKTRLAAALRTAMKGHSELEPSLLYTQHALPAEGAGPARLRALVDDEVRARCSSASAGARRTVWIVDDAELLYAHATEAALAELTAACQAGRLCLVMFRTRFVQETDGWFARSEQPWVDALQLARLYLDPLDRAEALDLAGHYSGLGTEASLEAIVDWSGGWAGLIERFSKLPPLDGASGETRDLLEEEIQQKVEQFELKRPEIRSAVAAALDDCVPPRSVLTRHGELGLGSLSCLGMINLENDSGSLPSGPCGRLWREVARRAATSTGAARRRTFAGSLEHLALGLVRAGYLHELCAELDVAPDRRRLVDAFQRIDDCAGSYPELCETPRRVLEQFLGILGLRRLLRALGSSNAHADSLTALSERVEDACRL